MVLLKEGYPFRFRITQNIRIVWRMRREPFGPCGYFGGRERDPVLAFEPGDISQADAQYCRGEFASPTDGQEIGWVSSTSKPR